MNTSKLSASQKGFATILILVGILVIVAVVGGTYYFDKFQISKSQPQSSVAQAVQPTIVLQPTLATNNLNTNELQGFPAYPNAIYIGKQPIVPCSNGTEQNGFSTCNAVIYSWKTSDDYDQVILYYRNKEWLCGGAGSYDGPRSASGGGNNCTKNNRRFGTFFDASAKETKIDFALYP
ncbi:MAG: hypothetical protein Q7R97_04915 [Candidatus Daviesbacteria bacterium]|nr:hypothetical protein [Candidatus Daviesbacteria bacterium]